ncbi:MAG TPA: beta-ketoacyl-ACP synthase II [Thermodesulfobacteriota bacterium]|nr:beta-ketoacyl-ACP synthase II [Thermodesulfobacteriota bacterium]
MSRRVVVTGIGLVTPLGVGNDITWEGICNSRSGVTRIAKFDPSILRTQIAGQVPKFDPTDFMDPKEARRSDHFIQFACAASKLALDDAGLVIDDELAPRVGTIIGSGIGGMDTYYQTVLTMEEKGPMRVSPFFVPNIVCNMASGYVSIFFNAKGPNSCTTTACAAGAHGVAYAAYSIQNGDADAMICGGTEAPVNAMTIAGFNTMRAISTSNDPPEKASRPFDKDRDGFIIAEGSGIVILEELEHAKKRGAKIYAEYLGSGMSGDAHHITSPSLDGPQRCMEAALKNSKLNPSDVDYINAHGTSTQQNDINETNAIKQVFNGNSVKIPVSSTKSMTGHLLGAAGGIEAGITSLSLYNGIVPPTINLDNPDEGCDLDYVPHEVREKDIKVAISNSFGFGGTNVTLAFKKFE